MFVLIEVFSDLEQNIFDFPECCTRNYVLSSEKEKINWIKNLLNNKNNKVNNKQVNVVLVDAEKEKEKAKAANVQGFPTIILENGNDKKEYRGARNAQSMMDFLENNL